MEKAQARQRRPLLGRRSTRGSAPAAWNASTSAARARWSRASRTQPLLEHAAGPLRVPEPARRTRRRASSTAPSEPGGDTKRLMLDRANYYATTGGHGACRGCGEVTAIRLVMATNHAHPRQAPQGPHPRAGDADRAARRQARRRSQDDAARRERIDDALDDAGEAALPARERPDRQRPGRRGDRQRHRLQQRLCLDLPVQPLQRPVGQQPVPGHARRSPRACSRASPRSAADDITRAAHRQARTRRRLRAGSARRVTSACFGWNQFTPEELRAAADRDQRWAATARPTTSASARCRGCCRPRHADQGHGAEHRRLFEHRRPGLDRELHRPGFRPVALRRRAHRQAGGPQGTRPDRLVPPQRVRGADLAPRCRGTSSKNVHGVPELHRRRRRCSTSTRRARPSTASPTPPPAATRAWRWKAA